MNANRNWQLWQLTSFLSKVYSKRKKCQTFFFFFLSLFKPTLTLLKMFSFANDIEVRYRLVFIYIVMRSQPEVINIRKLL